MRQATHTLLLFVDGLGLGAPEPSRNPLYANGTCPNLRALLESHAKPIDAALGVPGLPQSATGQASLLTGRNAARWMGRHVEGLPGPRLKELIREGSVFTEFKARGLDSTFANAYFTDDLEEVRTRRRQSVTTVAALAAFGGVRATAELMENRAVYQDLTRTFLRGHGYEGPLVTPRESGEHLLGIAAENHFTLFEYFLTDLAAHKGSAEDVARILGQFDEFLGVVLRHAERPNSLLVLTSDHGNIEDSMIRTHTTNPVPFVALGAGSEHLRGRVESLTDFVPALLELYS